MRVGRAMRLPVLAEGWRWVSLVSWRGVLIVKVWWEGGKGIVPGAVWRSGWLDIFAVDVVGEIKRSSFPVDGEV